uniref:TLC domain-containing protein n=1 Tax=Gasterosteus aculeatus aculeatus TaxID=481459 RepID=A0AAQ4RZE9_GASAC
MLQVLACGAVVFPGLFFAFRKILPCVFKHWSDADVVLVSERLVSSIHAVMATTVGVIVVSSCRESVINARHWLATYFIVWYGVPYMTYDIFAMYLSHYHRFHVKGHESYKRHSLRTVNSFVRREFLLVLHHIALLTILLPVTLFFRRDQGDFFVGCLFLTELSTPFVSLGKILIQPPGMLAAQGQRRHGPPHLLPVPHRPLPLHVLGVRPPLRHPALQRALPPAAVRQPGQHLHPGAAGLLVRPPLPKGLASLPARPGAAGLSPRARRHGQCEGGLISGFTCLVFFFFFFCPLTQLLTQLLLQKGTSFDISKRRPPAPPPQSPPRHSSVVYQDCLLFAHFKSSVTKSAAYVDLTHRYSPTTDV